MFRDGCASKSSKYAVQGGKHDAMFFFHVVEVIVPRASGTHETGVAGKGGRRGGGYQITQGANCGVDKTAWCPCPKPHSPPVLVTRQPDVIPLRRQNRYFQSKHPTYS